MTLIDRPGSRDFRGIDRFPDEERRRLREECDHIPAPPSIEHNGNGEYVARCEACDTPLTIVVDVDEDVPDDLTDGWEAM